jgi:hypothetical protein
MPMDWGLARDYAARDLDAGGNDVTEAEWLAATDPAQMLVFLREWHLVGGEAWDRHLTPLIYIPGRRRNR